MIWKVQSDLILMSGSLVGKTGSFTQLGLRTGASLCGLSGWNLRVVEFLVCSFRVRVLKEGIAVHTGESAWLLGEPHRS